MWLGCGAKFGEPGGGHYLHDPHHLYDQESNPDLASVVVILYLHRRSGHYLHVSRHLYDQETNPGLASVVVIICTGVVVIICTSHAPCTTRNQTLVSPRGLKFVNINLIQRRFSGYCSYL